MSQDNKRSSNSMSRGGKNSEYSMPIDLIIEIFSRLPGKSIARFRLASKLWGSILGEILTRSRARPRLLFALKGAGEWSFYSSLQPQNPSSLVEAADFLMKFSKDMWLDFPCLTSGLIYYLLSKKGEDIVPMICNPNTGQYAILPTPPLRRYKKPISFLGFDPIEKKFKILFMAYPNSNDNHTVLTLGTGKLRWRTIQCPFEHSPLHNRICIGGVLYYLAYFEQQMTYAETSDDETRYVIVCFDVRYETFKYIRVECVYDQLINYEGKLGGVSLKKADTGEIELNMWVLEDVKKKEWSKHVYTLPDEDKVTKYVSVVGMTATVEIVITTEYLHKPFYVFYFNPEKNTLQRLCGPC